MEFTQIGFTNKTHGLAGELKVSVEAAYEEVFLESDRVFLDTKGAKVPFFLETARGGGELIVKEMPAGDAHRLASNRNTP